jgi:dihydropteroate synthase
MHLRCRDTLLDISTPVIMGVLNITPDSFYAGSRNNTETALLHQCEKMLADGAAILDVGGASSRPGATPVEPVEEARRVRWAVHAILERFPRAVLSVDTWRAAVAAAALDAGASIVNDISGGRWDADLFSFLATRPCPYVLMHAQGTPDVMQQNPHYEQVVTEILDFFIDGIARLRSIGIHDIVLDPGFGFGKTLGHNFALLKHLHVFSEVTGLPVLAGLSRKSMICKPLQISPDHALNGTTALNMVALQQGARILRVHDVREAREAIVLHGMLQNA